MSATADVVDEATQRVTDRHAAVEAGEKEADEE